VSTITKETIIRQKENKNGEDEREKGGESMSTEGGKTRDK